MLKSGESIKEFLERNKEEFSKPEWHQDFETGISKLDRLIINLLNAKYIEILEDKCSKS